MMEYTDRHQRFLMSLLSRKATLFTEMMTCNALLRTDDLERFLQADFQNSNPLVLQLGGACPQQMRDATKKAAAFGYRNVNINCGCPSSKVSGEGSFGAALMRDPDLVAKLASAAGDALGEPVSVKCRIGVDDSDSFDELAKFISTVHAGGGVNHFIVHARKAILGGRLTPHENRTIPPLRPEVVYRLVEAFPSIRFTLNGGVETYEDAQEHVENGVAGVMVGRAVVNNPWYWRQVDSKVYGSVRIPDFFACSFCSKINLLLC
jgi:tRNA-dihydrouridine synthase A